MNIVPEDFQSTNFRATKARPCPVCQKPDWCLHDDPVWAICQRTESRTRFGDAGWLHRLPGAPSDTPSNPIDKLAAARGFLRAAFTALAAVAHEHEVLFPMFGPDPTQPAVGFRRRRGDNKPFGGDGPKALTNKGGHSGVLYGNPRPWSTRPVLLLEGEMDALAALAAGADTVLAVPGCSPGAKVWEYVQAHVERLGRPIIAFPHPPDAERTDLKFLTAAHEAISPLVDFSYVPGNLDLDDRLRVHAPTDPAAELSRLIESALPWPPPPPPAAAKPKRDELPEFPLAALPPPIAEYCTHLSRACQCPPDLPAVVALGMMSAALAHKIRVNLDHAWKERNAALWILAVQPSSSLKGPVFDLLQSPIRQAEAQAVADHKIHSVSVKTRLAILQKEKGLIEKQFAAGRAIERDPKSDRKGDADRLEDVIAEIESLTEVGLRAPQLVAQDCTIEALAMVMSANHGAVAIQSPEGVVIRQFMQARYSSVAPEIDLLFHAYSGEDLRVDRASKTTVFVRQACAPLLATIQSLEGLGDPALQQRGFHGRFLYALPPSLTGQRDFIPTPPEAPQLAAEWRDWMAQSLGVRVHTNPDGTRNPIPLSLTPEAVKLFRERRQQLESQMAPGKPLAHMEEWAGKAVGHALRIAGLLHSFGSAEIFWSGAPITAETAARALRILDYFEAHAVRAYSLMGFQPCEEHSDLAEKILAYLRSAPHRPALFSEIHRMACSRSKAPAARAALKELLEADRIEEIAPKPPGRRPKYLPTE